MADLFRSPKSGSEWTMDDLEAYNITICAQDTATFFGQAVLPVPPHHPDLFDRLTEDEMTNDDSYLVVRYMDIAMNPVPGEESAVGDFAMQLLRVMGYATRASGRDLLSSKEIPLFLCGESRPTKADLCLINGKDYQLIVHEDKQHLESGEPEPQLIAEAIAAVQSNNRMRYLLLGLDPLDVEVMAGITMTGTYPTFFKIPVTLELIEAIRRGDYPDTPTVVDIHSPEVPRPDHRLSEGMRPLDNRRSILACFEAFKQFVN